MMRSLVRVLPCLLLGFVAVLLARTASAATRLPGVLGDHMVVQRDHPILIWGWDDPGAEVAVTLGENHARAKAGDDGRWQVELPALPAGGPHEISIRGTDTIKITDVLAGEVWLASGQSNMEWTVGGVENAQEEIANARHPRIRHLKIPHRPSATPAEDVETDGWKPASPETVGAFTGVGYFFARELSTALDVPVGIIGSNWGGTRIEPWVPPEGFRAVPALDEIASALEGFPKSRPDGSIDHQSALALYNGMIHPLLPYPIRGAIWYQGESNVGEGMSYRDKMEALISGWRTVWKTEDLPFYFVQLAPYRYGGRPETALPEIWEAQTAALSIPKTGMAVTVDIGNARDIHPRNKQDVGKRLALLALAKTYGRDDIVASGPALRSLEIEGDKIRLAFEHVGGGLVSRDEKPLTNFEIAGADGNYVPAQAEIDGEHVVVHAEGVDRPTAVRFGWSDTAEPNLSNREGLPAGPFRTSHENAGPDADAEAFAPLWNGKDLAGWVRESDAKFAVEDGVLVVHRGTGWLRSEREFADFVLRIEFRFLESGANSGVFVRTGAATADDTNGWPTSGYQVQLMDNLEGPRHLASLIPYGGPGFSLEDFTSNIDAVRDAYRGTGTWNIYEITCVGPLLTVKLNGKLVTIAKDIENRRGHVGIQAEHGRLEFRKIEIRELP